MKYRFANKVEFYITNVCNLTCDNCNRFNNFDFKGFQRWDDYKDIYQRWSHHVEFQSIVLMGGEPLLNPTIKEWASGLADTFNCDVQILTNGFQLNRVPGLYNAVAPYARQRKKYIHFQVSLHNLEHFDFLRQQIFDFLKPPYTEWGKFLNQDAPRFHRNYQAYYTVQDVNGVQINMHVDNNFRTSAVQLGTDGRYRVHDSDPLQAHTQCGFVLYKSYHFIKGKLYKCGPAALLPEFDQQVGLELTDEQRSLMNAYQPFTIEQIEQSGTDVIATIDQPIPQCRFCSANPENRIIWPEKKASKSINIVPWPNNNKIP